MKALRSWTLAAVAALLAACGDGSIQSPDFTPVSTLANLRIDAADPQQGSQLPVGTTLSFRAIATIEQMVPPGTEGAVDGVITIEEDVSDSALWQSANSAFATVEGGVVLGVAPSGTALPITATYEGLDASVLVTVTAAVPIGVDHVRPRSAPERDPQNSYTVAAGTGVPFDIFGAFTDGAVRELDQASFDVDWSSSNSGVADNPADDNNFTTLAIGSTQITGAVTNVQGISPASASATLVVEPLNAFCESEFIAPPAVFTTEASALCIGCTVEQPVAAFDANTETFATMSIPLGLLLQSSVSVSVSQASGAPLTVGRPAGFLVSRSDSLLSAELLSNVTVETVACDQTGANCAVQESFGADITPLYLALLGLIGGEEVSLLSTPPLGEASASANGLRLTFSGGLVSAAAALNVHSACAVARELQ